MKKLYWILSIVVILVLVTCLIFTGCYHIDSHDINDYDSFMSKMNHKKHEYISKFFPKLEDTDCVNDMYLYYSDYDLLDSLYTVYLNCSYDDETYASEIQRLKNKFANYSDSISFDYEPVVIDEAHIDNSSQSVYIRCTYALCNEKENQIVYVSIFQKAEIDIIKDNIPNEYLPKEIQNIKKINASQ